MLGIDIGNNELKITYRKGANIMMVCEKLPTNMVRDGVVQVQDAMADFIRKIMKKNKLKKGPCTLILPPSQVFVRPIKFPQMDEERLRMNIPYEMKDYLAGQADKYYFDYLVDQIEADEAGNVKNIDCTVGAVTKTTIFEMKNMFQSLGVDMQVAIPQEMAYRNLLAQNPAIAGSEQDYCIMDIGHTSTRAFFYKGCKYEATKVIEFGCQSIDEAISLALDVDPYVASAYKETNHNNALEQPQGVEVYNSIAFEIMKALNFYGFNLGAGSEQHIYYSGGGSEIQQLLRVITETTGLEARSVNDLMPESFHGPNSIRCAMSLGATLQ